MSDFKASIISLTFGRYELTQKVFEHNLKSIDRKSYELLICDQGPGITERDREAAMGDHLQYVEYLKSLNADHLRLNHYNEGVARSLNQLMLRCNTDYIIFMPPDIELDENWLEPLVSHAADIPHSGIVGFEGQDLVLPERSLVGTSGKKYVVRSEENLVFDGCQVFGATLVTRELINKIGFYCEDYHPYAFEDSDYCFRAHMAGMLLYYIPNLKAKHVGLDHDHKTLYKESKIRSYFSNAGIHRWRMQNYWRIGIYVPPPMLREELI